MMQVFRFAGAAVIGAVLGLLPVVWSTTAALVLAAAAGVRRVIEPALPH